jgi:hypothetical protein
VSDKTPTPPASESENLPMSSAISEIHLPLPYDAWRVLERKMQQLRLAVLEYAADHAEDVKSALVKVVKSEMPTPSADARQRFPEVAPDDYVRLDRSLNRLRPLVVDLAVAIVKEREPAQANAKLTPDVVENAWDALWKNRSLVEAVLTQDVPKMAK